jgi:hypothetical protein
MFFLKAWTKWLMLMWHRLARCEFDRLSDRWSWMYWRQGAKRRWVERVWSRIFREEGGNCRMSSARES